MAVSADHFNSDFWLGVITAGPVLLVAFGTVFHTARNTLFRWSLKAESDRVGLARIMIGSGLMLVGGIGAPAVLTIFAGGALYDHKVAAPAAALALLEVAVLSFMAVVLVAFTRVRDLYERDESAAADADGATGAGDTVPVERPPQRLPLSAGPDVAITAAVRASRVLRETRRKV